MGAVLVAWAFGIAILLAIYALSRPLEPATVAAYAGAAVSAALGALFLYWTYALATLGYAVDRNGLVIYWGPVRQVIPLSAIERLVPGTSIGVPRVRGVSWLGYHVGRARIERIGQVLFYSTHQSADQVLYVMTPERNYAISVTDPAAFAREIQVRQDLGPTASVTHHVERVAPSFEGFWIDRASAAFATVAVAAGVALWAVFAWRYQLLPDGALDIRFPPNQAVGLAEVTKSAFFEIPRAAMVLLAVNLAAGVLLHLWDRAVANVAFAAGALTQAGMLAAFLVATRGL